MYDADIAPTRHKIDVVAYYRMAEAGILGEDDRIELIDGDLIDMAPIGQDHAGSVNRLNEAFVLACAGRAIVSGQNPIRIDEFNEPQPDIAILRRRADFYTTGERPGPADALLVMEVADSSLRYDRGVKLPLYARAGIAEYWILDLRHRTLEVHRTPRGGDYLEKAEHGKGERIALALMPEIVVDLDTLLG